MKRRRIKITASVKGRIWTRLFYGLVAYGERVYFNKSGHEYTYYRLTAKRGVVSVTMKEPTKINSMEIR